MDLANSRALNDVENSLNLNLSDIKYFSLVFNKNEMSNVGNCSAGWYISVTLE